jgi:hypothetical protein
VAARTWPLFCATTVLGASAPGISQTALYSYHGSYAYEQVGANVADGGDLNGDGLHEILIAVPGDNTLSNQAGAVRVYDGASGALVLNLLGPEHGAETGRGLANAGKIDGDAIDDIVVGSPGEFIPGLTTGGTVRLYSGATGALIRTHYGGTSAYDWGAAVAGLGDLDGDGRSEYIATDPLAPTANSNGIAKVYSGATGAVLHTHLGDIADRLGASVANLGDLDGDGKPDYGIGAHTDDNSAGVDAGCVRLYSGASGTLFRTIEGPGPNALFGFKLARAGDVDGDARQDIAVTFLDDPFAFGRFRVRIHSGATGALIRTLTGECIDDGFGTSLAAIGDWDGDGREDLAVGTMRKDYAQIVSGRTGAVLATWRERYEYAQYAGQIAVSGIGDLNGDGRPDLVMGFSRDDIGGLDSGTVRVYSDANAAAVGVRFGFGDGSGAACPCGNTGGVGEGCANSTGLGGTLHALGSTAVAADRLVLQAAQLPPGNSCLLFHGPSKLNGGLGVPFAGGLLAIGGSIQRLSAQSGCKGEPWWGPGLVSDAGWLAGQTRNFQVWYRDPSGPCGVANVTNAVGVTFTP